LTAIYNIYLSIGKYRTADGVKKKTRKIFFCM